MIKQLFNSVIAKYRDLSVSCRSIICLSLRLQQIIDLLATDKSRYFAQPCSIIVNYQIHFTKKEYLSNFRSFKICQIFEEFLMFLTQLFEAEVHNPKSRSAMEYGLSVYANYLFLENNYNGNPTCSLFGFETIRSGGVIRPNLIGHCLSGPLFLILNRGLRASLSQTVGRKFKNNQF